MAWWQSFFVGLEKFLARHRETAEIYAYFLVLAMRPELPWPFNKVPPLEWFWEWQRAALQSLFASKHPDLEKKVDVKSVEVQTTVASTPPVDAEHEKQVS